MKDNKTQDHKDYERLKEAEKMQDVEVVNLLW